MRTSEPPGERRRKFTYRIFVLSALIWLVARVLLVCAMDRQTPFLSANDRSRWCTVRALVELGTYRIDEVIQDRGWDTIDKVSHRGTDGQQHYYSSKPPLLAAVLSLLYWPIYHFTGLSLSAQPFIVGRMILLLFNGAMLLLLFYACLQIIERCGITNWGRIFAAAILTWGTFLTTFAVTINNHLPASVGVAFTLWGLMQIGDNRQKSAGWFALVGGAAGWAAANELPCLSLLALAALVCFMRCWRMTLLALVPASALVAVAFFGTNYAAHQSWAPPYAHRAVGEDWQGDNWYVYDNSYWLAANRKGVDRGEPNRCKYAFHTVLGHHGVLSLTPVWLLSGYGTWLLLRRRQPLVPLLVILLTSVCWLFFMARPLGDRNYAGLCCGFRWMFWLIPFWLAALVPAADHISDRRTWRIFAWMLFAISAGSALYGSFHPWMHPWPYALWLWLTQQ